MHLLEPLFFLILLFLIYQLMPVLAVIHTIYWGVISFLSGLFSLAIGLITILIPLALLMVLLTVVRHAVTILLECTLPILIDKFTHQRENQ